MWREDEGTSTRVRLVLHVDKVEVWSSWNGSKVPTKFITILQRKFFAQAAEKLGIGKIYWYDIFKP